MREVCSICWRHKHTPPHTHTRTPVLLSRPPNFRGSRGRRSGAIQLRISVLQLNSAVPEQNERPKPSGEKSADNPHLQSPAGNVASLQPLPRVKAGCAYVCVLCWPMLFLRLCEHVPTVTFGHRISIFGWNVWRNCAICISQTNLLTFSFSLWITWIPFYHDLKLGSLWMLITEVMEY